MPCSPKIQYSLLGIEDVQLHHSIGSIGFVNINQTGARTNLSHDLFLFSSVEDAGLSCFCWKKRLSSGNLVVLPSATYGGSMKTSTICWKFASLKISIAPEKNTSLASLEQTRLGSSFFKFSLRWIYQHIAGTCRYSF